MRHAAQKTRLEEIDGLRGWAALSVLMAHLCFGVFVHSSPPLTTPVLRELLEPLLGGTLDVAVFYVLSGDALAAAFWRGDARPGICINTAKRYVRLTVPILGSCLIVFLLVESGLVFNQGAASALDVSDWLGGFLDKRFALVDVVGDSGFNVFFNHDPNSVLNPFLGTMGIELVGSILVFAFFATRLGALRPHMLLFLFFLFVCFDSFLACFPFGMLCGHLRARGLFASLRASRAAQAASFASALVSLVAGTYCNRIWPGWYLPSVLASCCLVFSVYSNRGLLAFLSTRLSRWLGRISYPLYLVQFPIIVSFTSYLVVRFDDAGLLGPRANWLIILASAIVSLVAAVVFRPVEVLAHRAADATSLVLEASAKRFNARIDKASIFGDAGP